jgi:Rrf2 family protein
MSSARFAMAVHVLARLAHDGGGLSSEALADSVNTEAAFLRRVLRSLREAGLLSASEGKGGGYRLRRPARRITLAEVYSALEPNGPLAQSPSEPSARCPIGAGMRSSFAKVAGRARKSLLDELGRETVADVARRARRAAAR